VDGVPLEKSGLQFVSQRTGGLVIQVGSGAWRFESALSSGKG
jgi:hypothetical protein